MKKITLFFFCFTIFSAFAQEYSFVNGDPKFMEPNPLLNEKNPNLDKYVLKPGLPDGILFYFFR